MEGPLTPKFFIIVCKNCRIFLGEAEETNDEALCEDCGRDQKTLQYRSRIISFSPNHKFHEKFGSDPQNKF